MALNDSETRGLPGNGERDPGLDRLYRAADQEAPPASLDAAILAAARREVGARPHSLSSGLRRWRVPVSIAAVLVLSFSLVTLVKEEGGDPLMQPLPEAPPPRPAAVQPADSVQPAAVVPDSRQMREPAAAPVPARPVRREDAAAGAPTALGGVAEGNTSGGGPTPSASRDAAAVVAPEIAARPQPFRESASMLERSVPAAPPDKSTEELAARPPAVAERRAAPMAAPAEPAGARMLMQAKKKEAAASEDRLPVWHGLEKEPPQKWIERIVELRRQQRAGEAETLLAEFKRRFPDHPLPPGLQ